MPRKQGRRGSRISTKGTAISTSRESWDAKRYIAIFLTGVLSFLTGTVLEPLTTRYLPLLAEVIDRPLGNDPLLITKRWPVTGGCDPGTRVAMPTGGPSPDSIEYSLSEDPRVTIVNDGGTSWNSGALQVSMRAREGTSVQIENLSIVLLTRNPSSPPAWLMEIGEGGCGGGSGSIEDRRYLLDLDNGFLADRRETPAETPDNNPSPANFRGIVVTPDEPLNLSIEVRSCEMFYEWQIVVNYSSGGLTASQTIGSVDEPLRSIGGIGGIPVYMIEPGVDNPGRRVVRAETPSTAGCET